MTMPSQLQTAREALVAKARARSLELRGLETHDAERTLRLSGSTQLLLERLANEVAEIDAALAAEGEPGVTFKAHTEAVSRFLNELYAIMVDPLAEGELTVEQVKNELLAAALLQRERLAQPSPHPPEGEEREEPAMKMLVGADWLREKVAGDPDLDCEVTPSQSEVDGLVARLRERLQLQWGAPAKFGAVRAMVDYDDLRLAIDALTRTAPSVEPVLGEVVKGLVGSHRGEPDWCKLTLTYETSAWALRAHEAIERIQAGGGR